MTSLEIKRDLNNDLDFNPTNPRASCWIFGDSFNNNMLTSNTLDFCVLIWSQFKDIKVTTNATMLCNINIIKTHMCDVHLWQDGVKFLKLHFSLEFLFHIPKHQRPILQC